MKNSIILLAACLMVSLGQAQDGYTKSLSGVEWVKIESKADIIVRTHSKNELLIKANRNSEVSERAKGLRLVGEGGEDNTDIGFYVVQDGNTLLVKNLRKNESARIFLPKDQNVSVKSTWNGDIDVDGFSGEVEANARLNGSVDIRNVNGPVTANALNGDIDVFFNTIKQDSPISIYTTNGAVDVSMPSNTPAQVSLSSTNGEIYSNFDLKREEKEGLKSYSRRSVKASINNGGVSISLKSTNGNIYLRKK
ncbi:DUF4097 family beta strand repeat-containing protein [Flagellimonas sp.]|uniref:DUF4097 family beta strand repeat-containing protein n=1 Tax=Flagellimonas sp. TaxID=2058762 RepID=UPI003F49FC4A